MSQYKVAALLFLSVSLVLTVPVIRAETNSNPSTSNTAPAKTRNATVKDAIRTGKAEVRDIRSTEASRSDKLREIKNTRQEVRDKIQDARQTFRSERAKLHGERLQRRFLWYEERLNDIALRIQTRIDKEKAGGADVAAAQTALNTGKAKLATAVADGKKAVEMFSVITVDTWDIQKPEVKAAIDQANTARRGFVDARQSMMSAVSALGNN